MLGSMPLLSAAVDSPPHGCVGRRLNHMGAAGGARKSFDGRTYRFTRARLPGAVPFP